MKEDEFKQKALSAPEVARMCGVDVKTVHRWVKAGYFPGARKGPGKTSPYRIPQDEVGAFLAQMSQKLQERYPDRSVRQEGLARSDQRAILAALAEMLHGFEAQRTGTRFALIVEDDPDASDIFEFALKAAGFTTLVLKSGQAALTWLASAMPDVMVLDLSLPDIAGTEVLRHMRSDPRLAEVPVIVATAYPQMAEDIQDKANLVLTKPVRYSVLQSKAVELTQA